MTWIEILFWVGLILPIILGLYLDVSEFGGTSCVCTVLMVVIYFLFFGMIPHAISDKSSEYRVTCEVPVKILSKTMVDDKMIIIVDNGDKVEFTSYKDINKVNNNEPLFKRYYFKKVNFDPDSSKEQVEFK
jgi:hypothetical protein